MKRTIPLLTFLVLVFPLSSFAQEAFSKGSATAKVSTSKYSSATSVAFKAGVMSPAIAMADAQVSYTLCAAAAADPKCPKTAEVNGTARLSIRGADGKTVASSEVSFRQAVTAEGGRETSEGSIPISIHVAAPALAIGTYTAELEFHSNGASQSFRITPGNISVLVLKSRLH